MATTQDKQGRGTNYNLVCYIEPETCICGMCFVKFVSYITTIFVIK